MSSIALILDDSTRPSITPSLRLTFDTSTPALLSRLTRLSRSSQCASSITATISDMYASISAPSRLARTSSLPRNGPEMCAENALLFWLENQLARETFAHDFADFGTFTIALHLLLIVPEDFLGNRFRLVFVGLHRRQVLVLGHEHQVP